MKLIIDISEETYDYWKEHKHEYVLSEAIANAIPYDDSGDLISRSELKKTLKENEWITDDPFADGGALEEIIDNVPSIEAYPFERVQELIKLNQQFAQEIENLKRLQGEKINEIPKDFVYDTETSDFYCYRNKYTGEEIHITKDPKTYTLVRPQGECCGSCYLCDVGDCGADMRDDRKETTFDDYLKEQLKDPEFRKEWEKLCEEDDNGTDN